MYTLKYDDIFAEKITDAFQSYDKEIEIKILVDFPNEKCLYEKYKINTNTKYESLYILVTLDKKYKNITFLETEILLMNGETRTLCSNYSFEEKEIIKKVALQKMREEMFKNF